MGTLLDLAKGIEQAEKRIRGIATEKKIKVAEILLDSLVWRTPVDTSKALSNWQVTLGVPAVGSIQPYAPGYLGYTQQASATQTISVGKRAMSKAKPGESIFITNNVHYIIGLDHGSSRQAPAGITAGALLIARKYLRESK